MEDISYYSASYIQEVAKGSDAVFRLIINNGYEFDSISYSTYEVSYELGLSEEGLQQIVLTLKNINYSVSIEVNANIANETFRVSIVATEHFIVTDNNIMVTNNEDAVFDLYFLQGYTIGDVNYSGNYKYCIKELDQESGRVHILLILERIKTGVVVNIKTAKENQLANPVQNKAKIIYHANGGQMLDNHNGKVWTYVYGKMVNLRPNTSIGIDAFRREGSVLTSWNTAPDGYGVRVGLGSRASVKSNEVLQLYAQWAQWTNVEFFDYQIINKEDLANLYASVSINKDLEELINRPVSLERSAIITKYNGPNVSNITIPEILGGYAVEGIISGAFYYEMGISSIILPKTIRYLQSNSFEECLNLKEVYLSDNIEFLEASAFGLGQSVEKLYINAVLPPVYTNTQNGTFVNKIEALINHDGKKPKLVFFAGCTVLYGINSKIAQESFDNKYDVFNLGFNGLINAKYQLDLILPYLDEGDVLSHTPELGSTFQFLFTAEFDYVVFTTLEGNYDLLASLNLKDYTNVWEGFGSYLSTKKAHLEWEGYELLTYEDILPYVDKYGDIAKFCEGGFDNEGIPYITRPIAEFVNYRSVEKLLDCYESFAHKGIKVYFGYGAMSSDGLIAPDRYDIDRLFKKGFQNHTDIVKIIMNVDDCIYDKEYFYDANFHLSTEGSIRFTTKIIEGLKGAGLS